MSAKLLRCKNNNCIHWTYSNTGFCKACKRSEIIPHAIEQREMSLKEWVYRLNEGHGARKEYQQMKDFVDRYLDRME